MNHILIPLAIKSGVSRKKYQRFAEQGYSFIYYTVSFSCGLVGYTHTEREEIVVILILSSTSCIIRRGGTTRAISGAIIR